jgi:hypothetical protein
MAQNCKHDGCRCGVPSSRRDDHCSDSCKQCGDDADWMVVMNPGRAWPGQIGDSTSPVAFYQEVEDRWRHREACEPPAHGRGQPVCRGGALSS